MEINKSKEGDEYIVMLPYMAHGHLLPFISLASQIRRHSAAEIIIAATPLNIKYLSTINEKDITFAELPPPQPAENTENLRPTDLAAFFHASLSLEQPARILLRSLAAARSAKPPLCVVHDVFSGWAAGLAVEAGAPSVAFSTCGAYGTAAYVSIWLNLPHRGEEGGLFFRVPGFPENHRFSVDMLHPYLRAADGKDAWSRFFQRVIGLSMESSFWLCSTVEELEPFGLRILRNFLNAPVFCAGIGLANSVRKGGKEFAASPEECIKWLDSHAENSVVYVSFGSQNTIGAPEMMALAEGLETSGVPFLWAARPPSGFDPAAEIRPEWLPEGFEERARERGTGLVVRGWAPQVEILGHSATGAFLSHCGWNSVLEGLTAGVPIVGWPIAAEQSYNAKMLEEEMGVCSLLARGATGTGVVPGVVARTVAAVVGSFEMRRRAEELRDLLRAAAAEGGSVDRGIKEFLASILAKRDEISMMGK